jgi:hypothetical protein
MNRLRLAPDQTMLTAYFNGLRRDCETGEWQDIDVACPGLAEPFRSRIKKNQDAVLLFGPDGSPAVMRNNLGDAE